MKQKFKALIMSSMMAAAQGGDSTSDLHSTLCNQLYDQLKNIGFTLNGCSIDTVTVERFSTAMKHRVRLHQLYCQLSADKKYHDAKNTVDKILALQPQPKLPFSPFTQGDTTVQLSGPFSYVLSFCDINDLIKLSKTSLTMEGVIWGDNIVNCSVIKHVENGWSDTSYRIDFAYGPSAQRTEGVQIRDRDDPSATVSYEIEFEDEDGFVQRAEGVHNYEGPNHPRFSAANSDCPHTDTQHESWPHTKNLDLDARFTDAYNGSRTVNMRLNKVLQPILDTVQVHGNWAQCCIDMGFSTATIQPVDAPEIKSLVMRSSHPNPTVVFKTWHHVDLDGAFDPNLNPVNTDPSHPVDIFVDQPSADTMKQYLDRLPTLEKVTVPISTLTNADVTEMKKTWRIKESDNHYTMKKKSDQEIQDQKNAEIQGQKQICNEWAGMLDDAEQHQE